MIVGIPFRGLPRPQSRQIRKATSGGFLGLAMLATAFGVFAVAVLLVDVGTDGIPRLSWDFLNSFPSRNAEAAGVKPALLGTLWVMGFTALFAVPVGIGAAIYLEEFAGKTCSPKLSR